MLTTDLETLVLERAKRGLCPGASQRRQTLTRLSRAFEALPAAALGDFLAPQPAMPREPLAQTPSLGGAPAAASLGRFSFQAMVLGVLTGALVGFGAGVMATSAEAPSAALPGALPTSSSHAAPSVEHAPPAIDAAPRGETQEIAALPERAPAPQAPVVQRKAAAAPPAGANPGPTEATFYEELSYVRRAQSALQQGNGILALGLMRSLDEIQPSGALMAERNMTRVLALCQLDRTAEAALVARSMLSGDRAADVYRRRLASSCAGPSLTQGLTDASEQESVKDPGHRNTKLSNSRPTGHQQDSNP